jgi:hypothetical protein
MSNEVNYETVISACELTKHETTSGNETTETTTSSSCNRCSAFGKGCKGGVANTHDAGTQA